MQVLESESVTLLPEDNDAMPLGQTTKDYIHDEIKEQLNEVIDKFNPHGARKVARFLREWGLAGTLVAAPIALLALAGAGWYNAFTRVDKEARFQTTTENRLAAIEEELKVIHGDLAKQSVINHTALPLADFEASLPDLHSAIAVAKEQNVKISPSIMGDLGQKLTASASAPNFWPVAAQFISYRSQVNVAADFQSLSRANMPNCTDKPPTPMELHVSAEDEKSVPAGAFPTRSTLIPALYENCRFVLDSPEEAARVPFTDKGRAFSLKFQNCQIIYNGGPIAVFSSKPSINDITGKGPTRSDVYIITGQRLLFENCLFLFAIKSMPPHDGQMLTEQILTQNGNTLIVKLSKA